MCDTAFLYLKQMGQSAIVLIRSISFIWFFSSEFSFFSRGYNLNRIFLEYSTRDTVTANTDSEYTAAGTRRTNDSKCGRNQSDYSNGTNTNNATGWTSCYGKKCRLLEPKRFRDTWLKKESNQIFLDDTKSSQPLSEYCKNSTASRSCRRGTTLCQRKTGSHTLLIIPKIIILLKIVPIVIFHKSESSRSRKNLLLM